MAGASPGAKASGPSRREALRLGAASGAALLLSACGVGGGGSSGAKGSGKGSITALFMKQAGYSVDDIQGMTNAFHQADPAVSVKPVFVAYEALHDKTVAAAPAGTYDVVLIDVIWPAEFGAKRIVADVTDRWPAAWSQQMLGGAIKTTQYQGRFFGVPWILDTKYLFYNTEHLARAKVDEARLDTWDGVIEAARAIKRANITPYPLVWSWQQAEALICDYAQLLGAFDGAFLNSGGGPAFQQGGGLKALELMRASIAEGLTNPVSTQSLEEDVRRIFSAGQASMALNWTYMYSLANDPAQSQVAGKVKVKVTPAGPGGHRPGVNGSMALAIARGSRNQEAAWKYIEYLTSKNVQQAYAKSSLPVWTSSYDDPAVVKTNPAMVAVAKRQLGDMILRPQVKNYNAFSQVLQRELQNGLLGRKPAAAALADAAREVQPLLGP